MSEKYVYDWYPELMTAKDETGIPFGNIYWETDGPKIIVEAAKLRGVEPPEPGSPEHKELLLEINYLAQQENDELRQHEGRW